MASDPNCIFCKIVAGEIPCFKIFEDDETLAFMDINPGNDGHCLVIPRGHAPDLYTISDAAISAVARTARKVAVTVNETLAPDGINLVQANGKGAEQSVFHFHMHVLPRRIGDELKMNWGQIPGDMDAIRAIADRLRAALDS